MTEEAQVDVPQEGANPFETTEETPEEDTPASSPDENNEETTTTPAPDGKEKNKQVEEDPDKDKPFHQHPRWIERETEWKKKFNEQETRHQDDFKKIREEFGTKKTENTEQTEIPEWFGGEKKQWDAYREDRDKSLKEAEEKAYKRLASEDNKKTEAVEEATKYMNSELESIEGDKDLNPKGAKIDANKLLKYVIDNDLVDSKGRWNYKAGFKGMKGEPKPVATTKDKKAIAVATTSESTSETTPKPYKTSKDFQVNRPW